MQQNHHTSHFHIERLLRHRIMLSVVVGTMAIAIFSFAKREDAAMQRVYAESFSWISTHMHHEHPAHGSYHARIAKLPTTSGGGLGV